ncbi:MAG: hypothetical protein JWP35_2415 [Caulobacter sp.]|nr:hypothetical protein [Caulobacter sp.]
MIWWWWIIPGLIALFALVIVVRGLIGLFTGRPFSGLGGMIAGGLLMAIVGAVLLGGLDVQTYSRLTYERPVATIAVHQLGPKLFEATLTQPPPEGFEPTPAKAYQIHGDEWRIEARVLKWKGWANVLGLDTQYRLDRLSGRYDATDDELHAERSVYDLRPDPPSQVDLWAMARKYSRFAPVVDTLYGSGAAMPMADGATYEVWITQSGLLARPTNEKAREASATGWH